MREKTFSTIIRVDDPLVRDHQVHGVRIMPGVTFLDLIYRLALAAGFKSEELELRKIHFIEPIAVSKDFDRKLVLRLARSGAHWMVMARSQRWSKGRAVEAAWQENASAELHLNTDTAEFETKLSEPSPRLEGRDLQHIYSSMQSVGIQHGEFMRCSGTAWLAGDGVHAQLNASRVASSLVDHFYILPSLLDTATGLSSFAPYAAARFADQPCVPIYIDRFRAVGRFGKSCRVFLPIPTSRKPAAADFSRDDRLDFFDSNGKFLGRLEGLAFKKIRSTETLLRLTREEASPDPSIKSSETSEPEGEVIGNAGNGIRVTLRGIVAALLKKEASDVADDEGFYESGLESSHLLEMVRQLEKLCGREFYPTLLFEYPSIARLEEYLAREVEEGVIWDVTSKRQPLKRTSVRPLASIRPAVESSPAKSERRDAIAIIGMAGRYPKARNLDEFWENLKSGRDCIEEIPAVRWDHSRYPDCYAKWGGFIDDYDKFDPLFFNLSPREAEMMDPQERIFLETVWAAMEDSGYTRERLKRKLMEQNGKAGVFVGVMWGGYQLYGAEELLNGNSVAPTSGYWSLANRVSYLFDFQGPSMAVDTACSSSLTAIHLACQSIHSGECQVAIAGGVNLTLHPSKYVLLCQLKMASTDGRCRSFGADGDGYVPGEGVGAVLLKSLERAEADGDRIYGVIRSTAINHGGRSNGYSVPNPTAQGELIAEALRKGGVEASTIGFLEAHGTGTALGDPIEIAALTKAYQSGAVPKQSCPIGSLKSAIGHLEAAAGVAALTKVLLQLKHKTLVPSLHVERINSSIDFEGSPFIMQRDIGVWKGASGHLRRAGISSFGVGGANAHIIIEECASTAAEVNDSEAEQLLLFSAKNQDRLRDLIYEFDGFISRQLERGLSDSLEDIAWTLKLGREPLECRVAFVSSDLITFKNQLQKFLAGESDARTWTGTCKTRSNSGGIPQNEDEFDYALRLFKKGKFEKVAALWAKGVDLDWEALSSRPGKIISLPNYPFARERYWLPKKKIAAVAAEADILQPFFYSVETIEGGALLRKRFAASDRVLSEHSVRGLAVLPGAAILEMLWRGAEAMLGELPSAVVKHVVWLQPVRSTNGELDLQLKVQREADSYSFELRNGAPVCFARGKMFLNARSKNNRASSLGRLDITAIQERTVGRGEMSDVYAGFAKAGLDYGSSFQVMRGLAGNENEALSNFSLSDNSAKSPAEQFTLILDGAFQTVAGISTGSSGDLYLPFSVDELELTGVLPFTGFAHSRLISRDATSLKFNIDIADAAGEIAIRIRKLVLRRADRKERADAVLFFKPVWKPEVLSAKKQSVARILLLTDQEKSVETSNVDLFRVSSGKEYREISERVFEIRPDSPDDFELLWAALKKSGQLPGAVVNCWLQDGLKTRSVDEGLSLGVGAAFAAFRSLMKVDPVHVFRWIHLSSALSPISQMIAGFGRTLTLELPKHRCKVLEMDPGGADSLVAEIAEDAALWSSVVRYQNGQRLVRNLVCQDLEFVTDQVLRKDGVYLVTGGLGALSTLVAQALAERGHKVILIGRREVPQTPLGPSILYEKADISNSEETNNLLDLIRRMHGPIRGVIHAAGVIEDGLIARKDFRAALRVFQPKIRGTIELDLATAEDDLDCFVLFSSISALTGNVGQADYAAANAFMDAFAESREELRSRGKRRGRSLSINWPWWKEGGMPMPEAVQQKMARQFGLEPLPSESGINALFRVLAAEHVQIAVASGNREKLETWLGVKGFEANARSYPAAAAVKLNNSTPSDLEAVQERLAQITSSVLKVKLGDLDLESDLGEYGVDSVSLMEIVNEIEKSYAIVLDPSVPTEHPTLAKLARYLVNDVLKKQKPHANGEERPASRIDLSVKEVSNIRRELHNPELEPVAVIGAVGRFANSPRLEDFWKFLSEGKTGIREVPSGRWAFHDTNADLSFSHKGSFVDGIDLFDPAFFNIKESETAGIDPQQRIVMELTQELLGNAGYSRDDIKGKRAAVCIGAGQSDYIPNRLQLWPEASGQHVIVNQLANMVAARVSDFFHLRGPSWTVDTACSSSLVAIHQACQSLKSGESEIAIAGGIQLLIDPSYFVGFRQAGVLSQSGTCAVFDKSADGMVLGEGAGLVLLKPLRAAMRDGDRILGLIPGSATNNDGHTMGLTTPSLEAQQDVIAAALKSAKVDPTTIGYLEAHGTGTPLGDPVEIKAATQAFRKFTSEKQFCGVGSVKSNIGHLLRAAGVASFLKVLCALRNQKIPATLNCNQPHPRFRFEDSPFYPVTELENWTLRDETRRAGISSFGFGGTNCHMILEEFNARAWNYEPLRRPLPVTVFNRKRYWLGASNRKQNGHAVANENGHTQDPLKEMLKQLRFGEISIEEAKARI